MVNNVNTELEQIKQDANTEFRKVADSLAQSHSQVAIDDCVKIEN